MSEAPAALVTGAPGWLGTRLVDALVRGLPGVPGLEGPSGRRVRCLVLRGSDPAPLERLGPSVDVLPGDLTDEASVDAFLADARGATLFHAAGVIHPTRGVRQFHEVNVRGTARLIAAAARAGVRRLIYVSSNSPVGTNAHPDELFDETAPYNPYMEYGRSKMLAEQAVRSADGEGGLETVVIRPPWFYGPGQPPRQGLFFTMIKEGRVPLVGSQSRRSMAFIDNICQGLLLCERVDAARGQLYWIADRRPYPMTEVVDTIERVLERDFAIPVAHKRIRLPAVVSDFAWVADKTLQSVGLYNQKVHVLSEMSRTIACHIDKARRELGYDPKIELEEGMRRSVGWMLERGFSFGRGSKVIA
jgi:nucleoside-diphosphate-sugar epimerase